MRYLHISVLCPMHFELVCSLLLFLTGMPFYHFISNLFDVLLHGYRTVQIFLEISMEFLHFNQLSRFKILFASSRQFACFQK